MNEHRLWEQALFTTQLKRGRFTNRIRLEERFIEDRATGDYPYSTRLRYQIGYNRPLQGNTLEKHEFYLNMHNEFYFSLTGARNATYSEDWSYIGCGYDLGNMGHIELGYLLQVAVRNQQQDLRLLNLMQVIWNTNFTFKRAKK